ncbi:NAD-dependent epimerase/dehydratase family protein [Chryseobacterium taklimakanense]|uniref:NAD-dependent epimerase/dehydratase family protein n=1 Tax=Chryseobacterium taklimakanense TaxID=536441 RepID=UPI001EF67F79|nr:NAD-dependent epimerase/dehydratase family protein [Chryseobacterium taklimakanense]MCG7280428.1 NAD-dependent epimerase/dehydratase family protein [Chryseobacterium taklimakanense]
MKITITGASGFVGQNLSTYLEGKGNIVEKLSLRNPNFCFRKDANAIIHLAGKAHDTRNNSEESEYFKINTDLTKKLFDEFLTSNAKDFIYFSSVKAAADTVDGILDETCKADPQTAYGKSKLAAEEYLLSHKLPEGKRLFIIRPCMIHGPGNKGNLNLLYKVVEKGIPWPLAGFENSRSFVSIDNLNFLILKMLQDPGVPSGIYNFADDGSLSTNDLVKIISQASGKSAKLWKIPAGLIGFVAKIGDAVKLPLNSERLKKLTDSYVVSNQKIKTALKIENLPLSAEEGLIKTVKSFKSKS